MCPFRCQVGADAEADRRTEWQTRRQEFPTFDGKLLSNVGFWNLLYPHCSKEAYDFIREAAGYDTAFGNCSAADDLCDRVSCAPDRAVLCYAVTSLLDEGEPEGILAAYDLLLGDQRKADAALRAELSPRCAAPLSLLSVSSPPATPRPPLEAAAASPLTRALARPALSSRSRARWRAPAALLARPDD